MHQNSAAVITPADIARLPGPGLGVPVNIAFNSDGRWLAWLHAPKGQSTRTLYLHELGTGVTEQIEAPVAQVDESTLTLEEKLRRERSRDTGLGVGRFVWQPGGSALMVPTAHQLWMYDVTARAWQSVVTVADASIVDPRFSHDGKRLGWVQDGELFVKRLGTEGPPVRVSPVAEDGVSYGLADYIAQEEMQRQAGFWWAPAGNRIAFTCVDERHVAPFTIPHLADVRPDANEVHRYPFPGEANAITRLFVVDVDTAECSELSLVDCEYVARVQWSADGDLYVQVEDRRQQRLQLLRFDGGRGKASIVHVEESNIWINLHDMFRPLKDGSFVWASERTGFMHLEHRSHDGSLLTQLTSGPWVVDSITNVDEDSRHVWFTGNKQSPRERGLYRVSLDSGTLVAVTSEPGVHQPVLSAHGKAIADLHSALNRPPRLDLLSLDGELQKHLTDVDDDRIHRLDLREPTLTTVETSDGATLHVSMLLPDGEGPFPTVDALYGGPHVQLVVNSWSLAASLRAQYLRAHGVAVVVIDNRGSARRGLEFEGAIRHRAGEVEVRDHVEALEELARRGIVDRKRVGVYGWSYGGYLSAMCLAKAPELYRVAVSGAPVTYWEAYDTHYAERYMGLPSENASGYQESSVISHVSAMRGRLMLVHGLLDENVHFRHSARLIDAMLEAGVEHELLLFPRERHLPRGHAERTRMEARVTQFLLEGIGALPSQ